MEIGSNYGLTYQNKPANDWHCLDKYLHCLKNTQGQTVYLSLSTREQAKIPKEWIELMLKWTEGYKPKESVDSKDWAKWKDINRNFTEELVKEWLGKGFSYEQCADWINIGMTVQDTNYCTWLRDSKKKDSEWVLNHGNSEQLKAEYEIDQQLVLAYKKQKGEIPWEKGLEKHIKDLEEKKAKINNT